MGGEHLDFLLNKIVEWIKNILIGGIMDNLNGLFDGINGQVADIAGTVGATPQSWNSSVFNMIKGLSDNVIIPVAGVVLTAVMCYELIQMVMLTAVMCYELIQMVIDRNSLHDFETFVFFKWVVKAAVSVLIISHTWDIIMGIFDVAQRVVNGAAGNIISNADLDLSSVVSGMEAGLRSMELGPLFTLWSQTAIISLISWAMTICIFVVIYGRMIEIYLVTSIAPIPLATMANREWGQMGQNYLRTLLALGFQAFLIIVCVAIYAALVRTIAVDTDVIAAIWTCIGYSVLLCFALFKTSSLSRAIFNAH